MSIFFDPSGLQESRNRRDAALFGPSQSIIVCHGEWCSGEANTTVTSVENRVKTLGERVAVDKVEARSRGRTNVADNEVNMVRFSADEPIERAGPELRIRGELECPSTDSEEERLEVGILSWSNAEKVRLFIKDGASRSAVAVKRVYIGLGS